MEPYACFLGPDRAVTSEVLRTSVRMLDDDDTLSAVALSLDDCPPQAVSLLGMAWGRQTLGGARPAALFARSSAMVVRVSHFRLAGGYDKRMSEEGADLDLGWRLWLMGGSVRLIASTPACGTGPTGDAAPRSDAVAQFRDALATIYKCYDEDHLLRALSAGLLSLPSWGLASDLVAAVEELQEWLPELREERQRIQATRRRHDHEILGLFGEPLGMPSATTAPIAPAIEALQLDDWFGARRRILVITDDVLSPKMAGPAIRSWQICEGLSSEHEVRLATTSTICRVSSERFSVEAADLKRLSELERWCDVVILQGFVLYHVPQLRSTDKVMVVDVYDVLHLETLELSKRDGDSSRVAQVRTAVDTLNNQLSRGDFFICSSSKQRDYWLGHLSALGRVNPATYDVDPMLRSLIDVVPFGLPDEPPRRTGAAMRGVMEGIGAHDEIILWGGGIYNWLDPLTLIRAVALLRLRRPAVRLVFMGLKHPNPEVPEMAMAISARELAEDLSLTGTFVFFNEGWVSYADRQNWLLEADLGVSTHLEHAETAFSFRTRILDYLWAALPIVATDGDAFASIIADEGLGAVVPTGDAASLAEAMFRLLDDVEMAAECRKNAERVRVRFSWSTVLGPLMDFCRLPHRAPDLVAPEPVQPELAPPMPGRARQDARIVAALYRDGGVRRVVQGATQRLRRELIG
ncbi:MAG: glycosyltransferase [Acidimicrobiales bacterium]